MINNLCEKNKMFVYRIYSLYSNNIHNIILHVINMGILTNPFS